MRSPELENIVQLFKTQRDAGGSVVADVEEMRRNYAAMGGMFPAPEGVDVVALDLDGVPGERSAAPDADATRAVLYLHGGGYSIGSLDSHRHVAGHLAKISGTHAFAIDYRQGPEDPFPAAVEDAVKAYRWLLDAGYDPKRIAVTGDSAGGGLSVAMQVAARDEGLPLPACSSPHSPYADVSTLGDVSDEALEVDWLRPDAIDRFGAWYMGDGDPTDPLASPVYADLTGLPPMFIQAGAVEILCDTARRLAARAEECGVEVTLEISDDLPHAWHHFVGAVPEAAPSIERVVAFFDRHWR